LHELFALWKAKSAHIDEVSDSRPDEDLNRLCEELRQVEFRIYATPAATPQGLRIKADMARQYLNMTDDGTLDAAAFNSLLDGVAALAGGRA